MTRPDLAFACSQLSKFVQYPRVVHLQAAERVLQYVRGTYDQGITYFDPGDETKNKLIGWVHSGVCVCVRMRERKKERVRAGGRVKKCNIYC
jgi:hypothetical protein